VKTASKESVNCPARSRIRYRAASARCPVSIRKLRAAWVVQAPSGWAVMPARWARRVPCSMMIRAQPDGVHVDEVGGQDALGLRGQELLPGRPVPLAGVSCSRRGPRPRRPRRRDRRLLPRPPPRRGHGLPSMVPWRIAAGL
jgi:hypothetical protein